MGKALVSKNLKSSARPVVASISRQRDTTWSTLGPYPFARPRAHAQARAYAAEGDIRTAAGHVRHIAAAD